MQCSTKSQNWTVLLRQSLFVFLNVFPFFSLYLQIHLERRSWGRFGRRWWAKTAVCFPRSSKRCGGSRPEGHPEAGSAGQSTCCCRHTPRSATLQDLVRSPERGRMKVEAERMENRSKGVRIWSRGIFYWFDNFLYFTESLKAKVVEDTTGDAIRGQWQCDTGEEGDSRTTHSISQAEIHFHSQCTSKECTISCIVCVCLCVIWAYRWACVCRPLKKGAFN